MIQVLIVEDQRMARETMEEYFHRQDGYHVCGLLDRASQVEAFCDCVPVNLVIMDVCTQGDINGFEEAGILKQKYPSIKVIIVTSMIDTGFLEHARVANVDSMWYKDESASELMCVVKRTMDGESVFPDHTPEVRIGNAKGVEFTKGEIRVLRLLVEGLTYREIAERLDIAPDTVKEHVSNMLSKTGYTSKLRLATEVIAKKWIVPGL